MFVSFAFALTLTASSVTLTPDTLSATLTVDGDESFDISSYDTTAIITDSDNNDISVAINLTSGSTNITSATFEITATNNKDFNLGTASTTFTIDAVSTANSSVTDSLEAGITFDNDNFCSLGEQGGNLDIDVNIDNVKGFGEKDDEWYPLDDIEVTVKVKNKGNDKINDIVIEWGLYDEDTETWIIDDEESEFNLKDGKKKEVVLNFNVNPDDLDEDIDEDFTFYVKVYSNDLDEDNECTGASDSIKLTIEDDFVILDDITLPESASCGDEIQMTADVWNIGQDDQDAVSVTIYSKDLGINEELAIGDVNAFDSEKLDFTFVVPEELDKKFYTIKLWVNDEDGDVYENENNDESEFSVPIKIESCAIKQTMAAVSAEIESGGKAGEDLVIKTTITNTGDDSATYSINAAGYTTWADSVDLDKSTITLDKGDSENILMTFSVKSDVEGENTFDVEIVSENELITKQAVSVEIEGKSRFSGITGNIITEDNWYLWGIGILNIVLVIIIIVVAVRVVRR